MMPSLTPEKQAALTKLLKKEAGQNRRLNQIENSARAKLDTLRWDSIRELLVLIDMPVRIREDFTARWWRLAGFASERRIKAFVESIRKQLTKEQNRKSRQSLN
jgi:hypothetical protein